MKRTTQVAREETCCHYMDYSFRLAARDLLYAPSHRQDSTYSSLCYTSCSLAGMRNSSMGPLWGIDLTIHCTMSRLYYFKILLHPLWPLIIIFYLFWHAKTIRTLRVYLMFPSPLVLTHSLNLILGSHLAIWEITIYNAKGCFHWFSLFKCHIHCWSMFPV